MLSTPIIAAGASNLQEVLAHSHSWTAAEIDVVARQVFLIVMQRFALETTAGSKCRTVSVVAGVIAQNGK